MSPSNPPRIFQVVPRFLENLYSPGFKCGFYEKYLLGCDLIIISNLKMERALLSETLVPMYHTVPWLKTCPWPSSAKDCVQSWSTPHGTCWRCGARTRFPPSTSLFPCHYQLTNAPHTPIQFLYHRFCLVLANEQSRVQVPDKQDTDLSSNSFTPALCPTQPPIPWVPWFLPGGKAAGAWW